MPSPLLSDHALSRRALLRTSSLLATLFLAPAVFSHPQEPTASPQTPQRIGPARLTNVLERITRQTGVLVLADSTVADEIVTTPEYAAITPENLEAHINALVRELDESEGVTWGKLYLPAPPRGKKWTGEEVMEFVQAQVKLYGVVGAVGNDTIEVLAQKLSAAQAKPVIDALNLKPIYLISRRGGKQTYTGTWEASYGTLRIRQINNRVTGTYTSGDGVIEGNVVRGNLHFRWIERANNTRGMGRFTLAEDGLSFAGTWDYDDNDPEAGGKTWTGKRTSFKP